MTFCNGGVLSREQCRQMFGDWLSCIIDFSHSLHAMDIDISAFACLCALCLVTGTLTFYILYCVILLQLKIRTINLYSYMNEALVQNATNFILSKKNVTFRSSCSYPF